MPPSLLLRRLIKVWSAPNQPGKVRPGAAQSEIDAFEARYGVRLPLDLRDYLRAVNGMDSGNTDSQMTNFWGLDRIQPAPLYCHGGKGAYPDAEAARYFILCDIMIDSFWYTIRLTDDPAGPSPIVVWGIEEEPGVVARSFTEFLEAYLQDPGVLPSGMMRLQ